MYVGTQLLYVLSALNFVLQSLAQIEHFTAPIVSVSIPFAAVMELETAQMVAMRPDVSVSCVSFTKD